MKPLDAARARLRYGPFLALAARGRGFGRAYAEVCGRVDLSLDAGRADAAVARIRRWTGMSAGEAREAFRLALVSEAQEEADSAFFRRHDEAFDRWLPAGSAIPRPPGPVVYATLHFGHPVLGCVYLRRKGGGDVRPIIRGLDDANPMADPKRGWGRRKVAWVRHLMDGAVFGVDGLSTARAREHLLDGGAVFAALDVPGDVSDRAGTVEVAGEELRFSTGVLSLARMTNSTVIPMVAVSGREHMGVEFGKAVPGAAPDLLSAVFAEFTPFIRRRPGEWWLWPYVHGTRCRVEVPDVAR